MSVAAALCAALAVVVGLAPAPGPTRLRSVLGARSVSARGAADQRAGSVPANWPTSRRGRALAAGSAAVAGVTLLGWPVGAVLGAGLGVATWFWLPRLEPRARVRGREHVAGMLPLAADLLAAAVTAGCPPVVAAEAVGAAIGGPLGRALVDAAAAASVGADPARAWAPITAEPTVRPLARSLESALTKGTSPGPALRRAAADAREATRRAGEARARALGARAAAPLGLCFLPAFVLLGVVPIVVTSGAALF